MVIVVTRNYIVVAKMANAASGSSETLRPVECGFHATDLSTQATSIRNKSLPNDGTGLPNANAARLPQIATVVKSKAEEYTASGSLL